MDHKEINTLNKEILTHFNNKYDLNDVIFNGLQEKYDMPKNIGTKVNILRNNYNSAFLMDGFNATAAETIEDVLKKQHITGILRILYIGSENTQKSKIGIEDEFNNLKNFFNDNTNVYIQNIFNPSFDDILDKWEDVRPDIIIFSCHGDEEGIFLKDEDEDEHKNEKDKHYSNALIIEFLARRINYTKCVILSSCESDNLGKLILPFSKNVICFDSEVDIKTATKFNLRFFKYISRHKETDFFESNLIKKAYSQSCESVKLSGMNDSRSIQFLELDIID